ncbi:MAG: ferritin-like domain-containing protein, partial [Mycobacteriaceae bacterium]
EELATRSARAADELTQTVTAGRDAGLAKAEELAVREGDTSRAKTVRRARTRVGGLTASELPIPAYPTKNVADAVAAIQALTTAADLQAVLGFEEAHKNRRGVVSATQAHLATIAKDVVAIPTTDATETGAASTS